MQGKERDKRHPAFEQQRDAGKPDPGIASHCKKSAAAAACMHAESGESGESGKSRITSCVRHKLECGSAEAAASSTGIGSRTRRH